MKARWITPGDTIAVPGASASASVLAASEIDERGRVTLTTSLGKFRVRADGPVRVGTSDRG